MQVAFYVSTVCVVLLTSPFVLLLLPAWLPGGYHQQTPLCLLSAWLQQEQWRHCLQRVGQEQPLQLVL